MGIIKSFKTPKEDLLPIDISITGETTWEEFDKYQSEQDKRFSLAIERMKLCSILSGFFSPFETPREDCLGYKWCPHKEWNEHFKKYI